jgi:hypothetical protein
VLHICHARREREIEQAAAAEKRRWEMETFQLNNRPDNSTSSTTVQQLKEESKTVQQLEEESRIVEQMRLASELERVMARVRLQRDVHELNQQYMSSQVCICPVYDSC